MTTPARPVTEPTLEERLGKLEETTEKLKRRATETSRRVGVLEKLVEQMPDKVAEKITAATDKQTNDFKLLLAENETANADRLTGLARQWPAGSIILATLLGTGLVGFLTDLLLAAKGFPHIR